MNLVTMQGLFNEHVSDLSNDLDMADINAYLNRAYRYVIPTDVGGEFGESTWQLQTTAGTDSYPYAGEVIAPNGRAAWIESYMNGPTLVPVGLFFLDIETSDAKFKYDQQRGSFEDSLPDSILFYGRRVTLSPAPSLDYIVYIPVRGGPAADLTSEGITNDIHSMAIVTSAASEFLAESEDFDGVSRESALYNGYMNRLQVYAQARPNERRPARSF